MPLPRVPFYLMRHGETWANKYKNSAGWLDTPLSREGVKQAKGMAPLISQLDISTVYYSPLQRTKNTTLYATADTGLEVVSNDDLREANFGKFEGEPYLDDTIENWVSGVIDETNIGVSICENPGEPFVTFRGRITRCLNTILPNHTDSNPPLLVAHGGVFWALYNLLGHDDAVGVHMPNCCLIHIQPVGDSGWSITMLHPEQQEIFNG